MLSFEFLPRAHVRSDLCTPVSRRQWLQLGSLASLGAAGVAAGAGNGVVASPGPTAKRSNATAKSFVQIFLWGGPGAQETWDLKPHAPAEIRGEFRGIATATPGYHVCEHLPELARRTDRYTVVRSLTHEGVNHGTSAYHMLTGHVHWAPGTLRHPTADDVPNLAINAARFLDRPAYLPPHVHLPSIVNDGDGLPVPGQDSGFLGEQHTSFKVLGDLTQPGFRIPTLELAEGVTRERLRKRVALTEAVSRQAAHLAGDTTGLAVDASVRKAVDLLASDDTARAFDLSAEPDAIRARYGHHHFAQALLLARRLVEAQVPVITVYWNAPSNLDNQSWDTHKNQHVRMREHLLPHFDQALSAFLDELTDRGLIDSTLVAWYGEFGRTPKINRNGGRDHWGFCQSIGMAGGGVQPGLVYGTSTPDGAYAEQNPVRPDDLAATVYHCLGLDPATEMHDLKGRPLPLSYGRVVHDLLS
jgi:hypothetical protein